MIVYQLTSENLSNVGSFMGSVSSINYQKLFTNPTKAKSFADNEYGKPLIWLQCSAGWRTKDLGHVMYYVKPVNVD